VVAVGRLVPVKRLPALVDGLVRLRERVPDLAAVIVGEGYERPALESMVATAGAGAWLSLPGRIPQDQLVDLYRRAWAVTSFSGHEGWGMTLTEAGACGTPAVASDIPGHRDAVVHEHTGLLAAGDDALVDALHAVLRDDALRERLAKGALDRAASLTWDATAAGTLTVLADDARRRRRR
jgi:glycosyltransferase involved in cell wall biosynthesis